MGPVADDEVPPPRRIACQGLLGIKKKRCVDQRYFVIYEHGFLMNYYIDQQAFDDGAEPRGRVNIEHITSLKALDDSFQIEVDGRTIEFVPVEGQSADLSPWVRELERQFRMLGCEDDEEEEEESEEDEKRAGEESGTAATGAEAEEAAGDAALCHGNLEVTRKGKAHTRYFALYVDRMVYFANGADFASGAEFRGKVFDMSQVISLKEHSDGFTVMTESEGVPQAPLDFKGAAAELPQWHSALRRQLKPSLAKDYQLVGEAGPMVGDLAPAKHEMDAVEPEPTSSRSLEVGKAAQEREKDSDAPRNSAIVFIKPHAVFPRVHGLVESMLHDRGVSIVRSGRIDAETIDQKGLIDIHYGAIAARALKTRPCDLVVQPGPKADFEKLFGITWESAVAQHLVFNARGAASKLGMDPLKLSEECGKTTRGVDQLKFGGGFYVAKVQGVYVVNGFYEGMRAKFTAAGTCIQYFEVAWDPASLPWEKFRAEVIGATNPKEAAAGSVRNAIFQQWEALGLCAEPDTSDNAVHASASPFEGLAEKANWLSASVSEDPLGKALSAAGLGQSTVKEWMQDPAVVFEGKKQSLFDLLEDLDFEPCVERARDIMKQQTNSATRAHRTSVVAEQSLSADGRGGAREGLADSPPSAEKKPARPSVASRGIPTASERRASRRQAAPPEEASAARPARASTSSQRRVSPVSRQASRVSAAAPAASARATSRSVTPQQSPRKSEPKASARPSSAAAQAAPRQPPAPSRSPRSMEPPWMQAIGTEGVLASGPLTMQGFGVSGDEVYCALLPDRFIWSHGQAADVNSLRLASVGSIDIHDGGFEMQLCGQQDQQGGGMSKIQLHVATAAAGPRMLAKMETQGLRQARQVAQELLKWEEALHRVDWAALKQDDAMKPFVEARSQSARNIFRAPAEGRPPQAGGSPRDATRQSGQARSPSPRRGRREPAEPGRSPQAGASPRDAMKQSAQELPRCQGRLGFSVQGTLQWRYAMLFADRLDAWDSKEAAIAGQLRSACPPIRITTSTCQALGFVDQGFLLKCAGKTHGVHVGPDQDDLARWSGALASALAESRPPAAASPGRPASPGRQQPKQSSGRGGSPSPGRAASASGRRAASRLDRSITLRKDDALFKDDRPRRAKV